jgi:glycerophosphoryl diester phosphodiesterase
MWKLSPKPVLVNPQHPLIMAHRGDSANVPENTMQAFEDAYRLGVDCLETDTHMTADGEFVLFHDPNVNRTTNGKGPIAKFKLAELKALDAGFYFDAENNYPYRGKGLQILTIDEVLPRFQKVRFNLDIKSRHPDAPARLAKKLTELNVEDRVVVGSFWQKQIKNFRHHSSITTSAGPFEVIKFRKIANKWVKNHPGSSPEPFSLSQSEVFGQELGYYALQIPEGISILQIITPEFIKFAHGVGIAIQVWTINERSVMERLLDWGVDGIFTDCPNILKDVIKMKFP